MTNKVFMLLDRSGSMSSMWEQAISGINDYVKKLDNKKVEIQLAAFDTEGYDILRNCTVKSWTPLEYNEVKPRGGTPLLDASGRMLWSMLDSKADRAIMVVITDGGENESKKFTKAEIQNLTRLATKEHDYEMVFLGANFDGVADVAKQNFAWNDMSRVMSTSTRGFGQAMNATATASMNYFTSGKASAFYSDEDKKTAKS